ncbi:polygalacturonase E precursor [Mollisia scopiformis]|uniref:endo-polygalacturonase n=1 Tax=Mollisia scopiformis TaxID=149040 RepID=A0A132B9F9_MOLSC|nr:polygalacturonase E precursor [Mollisia scopiformis]KUJ08893.1 polygalacturonase E precursor [Mollisia scopiformis]
MVHFSSLILLSAITSVFAAPAPAPTAAPDLAKRATTCTFSGSAGASSASKSKTSCSTIILSALAVPSGTTLDLTDLNEGTTVIFEGITTFGYEEWSGPLVSVSGTDITVTQTSGAYLDGGGAQWWDGEGSNGGKTKPKFFYAHNMISSTISDIYIYNPPVQVFSIDDSTDLTMTDITINGEDGDSLGANTDGFDIGDSTSITITGANVYNQDDCVAVNSGTTIVFSGGVCSGGHGLSIGSVGGRTDNTVSGVTFENSEVKDSQNGVRIKTISGDTGSVSGVTYSGITLSGITDYGIVVRQDYDGTTGDPTNGITIKDFVLDGVTGTVESSGTNIWILCGSGSCTDWTWTDVDVTGGATSTDCTNVPSGASCSD